MAEAVPAVPPAIEATLFAFVAKRFLQCDTAQWLASCDFVASVSQSARSTLFLCNEATCSEELLQRLGLTIEPCIGEHLQGKWGKDLPRFKQALAWRLAIFCYCSQAPRDRRSSGKLCVAFVAVVCRSGGYASHF